MALVATVAKARHVFWAPGDRTETVGQDFVSGRRSEATGLGDLQWEAPDGADRGQADRDGADRDQADRDGADRDGADRDHPGWDPMGHPATASRVRVR